jgi:hypothetical protein
VTVDLPQHHCRYQGQPHSNSKFHAGTAGFIRSPRLRPHGSGPAIGGEIIGEATAHLAKVDSAMARQILPFTLRGDGTAIRVISARAVTPIENLAL